MNYNFSKKERDPLEDFRLSKMSIDEIFKAGYSIDDAIDFFSESDIKDYLSKQAYQASDYIDVYNNALRILDKSTYFTKEEKLELEAHLISRYSMLEKDNVVLGFCINERLDKGETISAIEIDVQKKLEDAYINGNFDDANKMLNEIGRSNMWQLADEIKQKAINNACREEHTEKEEHEL